MGEQQILFVTILYILSLHNVLSGRQYENILDFIGPPSRKEIITSKPSITETYGQYKELGSINNKGSNSSNEASFSHSEINSRKFNVGSEISVNTLGVEVKSSIGGELSWNKKETISVKKTIPAHNGI